MLKHTFRYSSLRSCPGAARAEGGGWGRVPPSCFWKIRLQLSPFLKKFVLNFLRFGRKHLLYFLLFEREYLLYFLRFGRKYVSNLLRFWKKHTAVFSVLFVIYNRKTPLFFCLVKSYCKQITKARRNRHKNLVSVTV